MSIFFSQLTTYYCFYLLFF